MIPTDAPLGLSHEALRIWTVALLALCAVATGLIAIRPRSPQTRDARLPPWIPLVLAAVLVRALVSLDDDGHVYDVLVSYRSIGDSLFAGREIWRGATESLATYPPTSYLWWAVAASVPASHPHVFAALVRAPFWIADAAISVVLLRLVPGAVGDPTARARAAWIYALCPIAIAVPTLHGQSDPIVDLLLVAGVVLLERHRVGPAGLVVGLAIAVKQWPVFLLLPLLAVVPRRRIPSFLALAAAPALVAYGLYGLFHPADAVRGVVDVATYRPHREGLGTSLLFADAPAGVFITVNLAVALAGGLLGALAASRGRGLPLAMALDMLVLVGLSPTVSDQYLMWPIPFLLLAGRMRTAALLGMGLLPAVLALDLWTNQNDGATPDALLVLATGSLLVAAVSLMLPARPDREAASGGARDVAVAAGTRAA